MAAERDRWKLGTCDVTIPPTHEIGEIETPSIWQLEVRGGPHEARRFFTGAEPVESDAFFQQLQERIGRLAAEGCLRLRARLQRDVSTTPPSARPRSPTT